MKYLSKHWPRIAVTLIALIFALLHAADLVPLGVLQRLDAIIYDARLRATMPQTLDDRIVIVDLDEKSLAEVGRWPWSRNKLAALTDELFERQKIALLGFDVVFAEPDHSSGLQQLTELARNELRDQPGFVARLAQVRESLDYDAAFARSLKDRPVALGYYLTSDRDAHTSGALPAPVMDQAALKGRQINFTSWTGYGANIDPLAKAAPMAGFFNMVPGVDGVVRSIPLVVEFKGQYYESLSLAMFRMLAGLPKVTPGFAKDRFLNRNYQSLESIVLQQGDKRLAISVDKQVGILVPFRGYGGPRGGSFKYVSASDVLSQRLAPGSLRDKIVLVGTTAPGLIDLRTAPVGEAYPGVETHANIISGLLDGKVLVQPDYTVGYEVALLTLTGLLLALALPGLSAARSVLLSALLLLSLVGLNFWLYLSFGLVLPLATALVMAVAAFALNMSYGYFVESRSKRELAHLFGTYVPPELVDEMVKDPDNYSMTATNKELTVMFCDMRGFTNLSERMEPSELQHLLNRVFSQLTSVIRSNRGTIDKYMGDCVMAFWGAPVATPEHAQLAVKAALEMSQALQGINQAHRAQGLAEIGLGIGLNTGNMCVGDMGSDIRRSYTVIGDAVNLGSRLEGLSKVYGLDIVVNESTRQLAPGFAWQELDKVRVKGKVQAVSIFYPLGLAESLTPEQTLELKTWGALIKAYRAQEWDPCDLLIVNLLRMNPQKYLYQLYAQRIASMRLLPFDPAWDGATNFETK
ncbi:MAG: adenylate/guanylate cyclase domain-containing protein [Gammaproteobacteria bacterium]|uniref:CHASE2 domain-containing protein n=1 Tax=Rhodoferax sp. TaxID=50421 RepID=UPI0017CA3AB6|nr:adenylate/guanylate cyclase domain-containing protein [Rhodoferax sp.]MBU3898281.1 adenylate/guanylate cyclase domain-containing protein [Gammaproteobacteria bacterium]MBA3059021.1 adenylate/guanylate cyclase domain-containing protein [Rhodoferax sp.]MBU3998659.1 adenylate/guanylate cyclase domain-containing protein [Gammaproteobacteria bacterium]MBU4081466.1 adenylate/guanylate cyclase domain-containing protein [Gammaproteobacteria bacterium]MBU4114245.1 adenylate/guanylate cyclase domain-